MASALGDSDPPISQSPFLPSFEDALDGDIQPSPPQPRAAAAAAATTVPPSGRRKFNPDMSSEMTRAIACKAQQDAGILLQRQPVQPQPGGVQPIQEKDMLDPPPRELSSYFGAWESNQSARDFAWEGPPTDELAEACKRDDDRGARARGHVARLEGWAVGMCALIQGNKRTLNALNKGAMLTYPANAREGRGVSDKVPVPLWKILREILADDLTPDGVLCWWGLLKRELVNAIGLAGGSGSNPHPEAFRRLGDARILAALGMRAAATAMRDAVVRSELHGKLTATGRASLLRPFTWVDDAHGAVPQATLTGRLAFQCNLAYLVARGSPAELLQLVQTPALEWDLTEQQAVDLGTWAVSGAAGDISVRGGSHAGLTDAAIKELARKLLVGLQAVDIEEDETEDPSLAVSKQWAAEWQEELERNFNSAAGARGVSHFVIDSAFSLRYDVFRGMTSLLNQRRKALRDNDAAEAERLLREAHRLWGNKWLSGVTALGDPRAYLLGREAAALRDGAVGSVAAAGASTADVLARVLGPHGGGGDGSRPQRWSVNVREALARVANSSVALIALSPRHAHGGRRSLARRLHATLGDEDSVGAEWSPKRHLLLCGGGLQGALRASARMDDAAVHAFMAEELGCRVVYIVRARCGDDIERLFLQVLEPGGKRGAGDEQPSMRQGPPLEPLTVAEFEELMVEASVILSSCLDRTLPNPRLRGIVRACVERGAVVLSSSNVASSSEQGLTRVHPLCDAVFDAASGAFVPGAPLRHFMDAVGNAHACSLALNIVGGTARPSRRDPARAAAHRATLAAAMRRASAYLRGTLVSARRLLRVAGGAGGEEQRDAAGDAGDAAAAGGDAAFSAAANKRRRRTSDPLLPSSPPASADPARRWCVGFLRRSPDVDWELFAESILEQRWWVEELFAADDHPPGTPLVVLFALGQPGRWGSSALADPATVHLRIFHANLPWAAHAAAAGGTLGVLPSYDDQAAALHEMFAAGAGGLPAANHGGSSSAGELVVRMSDVLGALDARVADGSSSVTVYARDVARLAPISVDGALARGWTVRTADVAHMLMQMQEEEEGGGGAGAGADPEDDDDDGNIVEWLAQELPPPPPGGASGGGPGALAVPAPRLTLSRADDAIRVWRGGHGLTVEMPRNQYHACRRTRTEL